MCNRAKSYANFVIHSMSEDQDFRTRLLRHYYIEEEKEEEKKRSGIRISLTPM